MTPKERMQRFMEIAIEKGFDEMASQMNQEQLECLIKSLVPEPEPDKQKMTFLAFARAMSMSIFRRTFIRW